MNLANKTVLVTGGTKGIGRAIAEAMADQGANVIVNYSRDEKAAKEIAEVLSKKPVKNLIVKADIASQKEVEAMFAKIKKEFSSVDILINSAGLFDEDDNPDNIDAFENVFKTNFLSQIRITNHTRKLMKKVRLYLFPQSTEN